MYMIYIYIHICVFKETTLHSAGPEYLPLAAVMLIVIARVIAICLPRCLLAAPRDAFWASGTAHVAVH